MKSSFINVYFIYNIIYFSIIIPKFMKIEIELVIFFINQFYRLLPSRVYLDIKV